MLKIQLASARGDNNILREDLTVLKTDPAAVKELHAELFRLCKEHHGVGVAANQVGVRENFFFVNEDAKFPTKNGRTNHVAHMCINPTWKPSPKSDLAIGTEGCMSLPGREFAVYRHGIIEAEWVNALGHPQKKTLKDWAARVFQHEHDHLRGVLLTDHATEIK